MKERLSKERKNAVKQRYKEHPLYRAFHGCCKEFETTMTNLRLSPEEVMLEVIDRFDTCLSNDDPIPVITQTLWDDIINDLQDVSVEAPYEEFELATAEIMIMLSIITSFVDSARVSELTLNIRMSLQKHYPSWMVLENKIKNHLWRGLDEPLIDWVKKYIESEECISDEIQEMIDTIEEDKQNTVNNNIFKGNIGTFIENVNKVSIKNN